MEGGGRGKGNEGRRMGRGKGNEGRVGKGNE
jgi:hypothetical protein